jgi:hypothetical protein
MSSTGQPTKMTLYLSHDQVQTLYGIARQWLPLNDPQFLEVEMDVVKEALSEPPELLYLRRENERLTAENERLASQVRMFQSILDELQSEVRAVPSGHAKVKLMRNSQIRSWFRPIAAANDSITRNPDDVFARIPSPYGS